MTLTLNELSGLGQAEIVAAILGPVVTGGADVYRTYAEGKHAGEELKQRQREVEQAHRLQKEQFEAAERTRLIQQKIAMRESAASRAWWQANLPLILFGVAGVALVLAAGRRM